MSEGTARPTPLELTEPGRRGQKPEPPALDVGDIAGDESEAVYDRRRGEQGIDHGEGSGTWRRPQRLATRTSTGRMGPAYSVSSRTSQASSRWAWP